jgi:hypothetical protein
VEFWYEINQIARVLLIQDCPGLTLIFEIEFNPAVWMIACESIVLLRRIEEQVISTVPSA